MQTSIGEMWLDGGVLHHRVDSLVVSAEAAREVREAVLQLTGGRAVPAVIDIRNVAYAGAEARRLFGASEAESLETATALVVGRGSSEAMAKVFVDFTRPERPVRVFTDEQEAVEWARGYLDEP